MTRYGRSTPMISEQHYKIIMENADRLNSAIVFNRDFNYQYFGFKTLERSYLLKIDGRVVERPQHMLMRVSVGKFWVFSTRVRGTQSHLKVSKSQKHFSQNSIAQKTNEMLEKILS